MIGWLGQNQVLHAGPGEGAAFADIVAVAAGPVVERAHAQQRTCVVRTRRQN